MTNPEAPTLLTEAQSLAVANLIAALLRSDAARYDGVRANKLATAEVFKAARQVANAWGCQV